MKVALIIPYFGKFPNYFDLFLDSCENNKNFDFYIFTDQKIKCDAPNIFVKNFEFSDCAELIKKRVNNKYVLWSPYKLCDYKPVFGEIFYEYIKGYDYWGYCDCDLILGDLNKIKEIIDMGIYDKILSEGHLTFYRNTTRVRTMYKNNVFPAIPFSVVAKIKSPCFYDELSFAYICKKAGLKIYENKDLYADVLPNGYKFELPRNNISNQIFKYQNGILRRVQDDKEYIYIHLQKRNMHIESNIKKNNYYIVPNNFSNTMDGDGGERSTNGYYRHKLLTCMFSPSRILIKMQTFTMKRLLKQNKNVDLRIYAAKNLGDDLFLKIIAERYPDYDFHICPVMKYDEKDYPGNVVMYDTRKDILCNKILHKLKIYNFDTTKKIASRCMASVVVGGSIFQQHATWKYTRRKLEIFHNLVKPYYILGCNFGPYQDQAFLRRHKKVIREATDVCFRDQKSYNIFKGLPNVRNAADLAFSLDTSKYKHKKIKKKVVISVIDLSWRSQLHNCMDSYEEMIIKIIKQYLANGYKVELMSFSKHEGDENAIERICGKIDAKMRKRLDRFFYDGNVEEALSHLGECEVIVATRFHANILGFLLGKKVLPIIYSNKTRNLLDDIGFDGRQYDIEQISKKDIEDFSIHDIKSAKNVKSLIKSSNNQFMILDELLKGTKNGKK